MLTNSAIKSKPVVSAYCSMQGNAISWLFPKTSQGRVCFAVKAEQVEILKEPSQFYAKLKELTAKSRNRITLSSLYIGNGPLEKELVNCLRSASAANPKLETTILLDYTRGNRISGRQAPYSSTQLLQPLVGPNCNVSFFLSPELRGSWFKRKFILPNQKWNEIIGLQHMKCFLFDNDIIISGANLSDQYFVNRNDRYILFKDCKPLCDYFNDLVKTVSTVSLQLMSDGTFSLHESWKHHPVHANKSSYDRDARQRLLDFKSRYDLKTADEMAEEETFVMPFLQMKQFGIVDDQEFTSHVISNTAIANVNDMKLASGYFNLTNHYMDLLISRRDKSQCDVLMASEQVNSFYNAKGLTGYIPSVYTQLGKNFFRRLKGHHSSTKLWSFSRPKWTFHAKGLWLEFSQKYMLSTIGSTNFGYRSVNRDLEAQLAIVTRNDDLKRRLIEEYGQFWRYAEEITDEHKLPPVPRWVQLITPLIKSFF